MRLGKIPSGAEYQINEHLQNLWVFGVLIVLQIVFFWKFFNFTIRKIFKTPYLVNRKIFNLDNSKKY